MKRFLQLSATTAVAVALTACGSGSGTGANVSLLGGATMPLVSANTTSTTTTSDSTSTTTTDSTTLTGMAYTGTNLSGLTAEGVSSTNIDTLIVGGRSYDLSSSTAKSVSQYFNGEDGTTESAISNTLSNAKYGWIAEQADSTTTYYNAFYQGTPTDYSTLPSSTATYAGYAVGVCTLCSDASIQYGTSNLTADFANKSLTGTVALTNANTSTTKSLNLSATIADAASTFTGTSSDSTTTSGAFFGTSGEEVSGVFSNDAEGYTGAFGATKQ